MIKSSFSFEIFRSHGFQVEDSSQPFQGSRFGISAARGNRAAQSGKPE